MLMPLLHGPGRVHEVKTAGFCTERLFNDGLHCEAPVAEFGLRESEHATVGQKLCSGEEKLDGLEGSLDVESPLLDPLLDNARQDWRESEDRLDVREFVEFAVLGQMQHFRDKGAYPTSLWALVPAYLDDVPDTADGREYYYEMATGEVKQKAAMGKEG